MPLSISIMIPALYQAMMGNLSKLTLVINLELFMLWNVTLACSSIVSPQNQTNVNFLSLFIVMVVAEGVLGMALIFSSSRTSSWQSSMSKDWF